MWLANIQSGSPRSYTCEDGIEADLFSPLYIQHRCERKGNRRRNRVLLYRWPQLQLITSGHATSKLQIIAAILLQAMTQAVCTTGLTKAKFTVYKLQLFHMYSTNSSLRDMPASRLSNVSAVTNLSYSDVHTVNHTSCSKLSIKLPSDAKYAGMKWSATIVLQSFTLPYASCGNYTLISLYSIMSKARSFQIDTIFRADWCVR